ncbi:MAG TPA: NEW3 domain-containing protein, partial [Longimicrobiales bacterium]|nr:NEW3 domain-containing protein [Longimicrobiales bacterium]
VSAVAVAAGDPPGAPLEAAVPGQSIDVHVTVRNGGTRPLRFGGAESVSPEGWRASGELPPRTLAPGELTGAVLRVSVPPDAEPSRPWFHRASIARNTYAVRDSSSIHLGEAAPRLLVGAVVEVDGGPGVGAVPVRFRTPVRTLEADPPFGTWLRDLAVVPPVSREVTPGLRVLRPGAAGPFDVAVRVASAAPEPADAAVTLEVPAGWSARPARADLRLAGRGATASATFTVTPPPTVTDRARLEAVARLGGRDYREHVRTIRHRDLAARRLYAPAGVGVVPVDVTVAEGLRVGYVMGVGDEVPAALEQLGARVTLLDTGDLASADLSAYDAVVAGTRAYAVRQDLVAHNARLLDYARSGGNLVVLYQTPEFAPETQAPFPASLPGDAEEVSEEDAPVSLLAAGHPLLTTPNRIAEADFEGWIEQRGSKFFASWDGAYVPLVETHDTGQAPQRGVWLSAEVGAGRYTYVALALHRQLPYGVPGAYRILANLITPR